MSSMKIMHLTLSFAVPILWVTKTTRISSILNPATAKWRDFPFRGISLDGNMQISYIWRIQWGYSSVGRATGSQSVGHGFDSHYLHSKGRHYAGLSFFFKTDSEFAKQKTPAKAGVPIIKQVRNYFSIMR